MQSEIFWYFGFGSLMNKATRPGEHLILPATLHGFSREWSYRSLGGYAEVTALNIIEAADKATTGVLVAEPIEGLASLDIREQGYDRLEIDHSKVSFEKGTMTENQLEQLANQKIYVYQAKPEHYFLADDNYPILQTYVDVVVAGLLEVFGYSQAVVAVQNWLGFDRSIFNDRAAPIYPRAVVTSAELMASVDSVIAAAAEIER